MAGQQSFALSGRGEQQGASTSEARQYSSCSCLSWLEPFLTMTAGILALVSPVSKNEKDASGRYFAWVSPVPVS